MGASTICRASDTLLCQVRSGTHRWGFIPLASAISHRCVLAVIGGLPTFLGSGSR